jgi:hypothetical protein
MTPENIQMAIARNFGGTENHVKLCEKYFGNVLKMFNNYKSWLYKPIPTEQLIDSNLNDSDARHLMVIGKSDSIVNLLTYQLKRKNLEPVIMLGSQFLNDRNDYYSYNILSKIMVNNFSFFFILFIVLIMHIYILFLDVCRNRQIIDTY